jgi:hypothetical protein
MIKFYHDPLSDWHYKYLYCGIIPSTQACYFTKINNDYYKFAYLQSDKIRTCNM